MTVRQRRGGASGVTLIELLVALGLVGVVLAAAGTMLLQAYINEATYREQNEAQQNAHTALNFVTDDLRRALKSSVPGQRAFVGVGTASNPVRFRVLDDDGATTKLVRYWLDAANRNLMREVEGQNSVVIARNIASPDPAPGEDPVPAFVVAPSDLAGNGAYVVVTATIGSPQRQSTMKVRSLVYLRNVAL